MNQKKMFLTGPEQTKSIGTHIGKKFAEALKKGSLTLPFLITLTGDLGAGKTTLCQGLCQALAVPEEEAAISPTFALAHEYKGMVDIFHLDVYRLDTRQFYEAGLDEYLTRPGLTLIEWPDRLSEGVLPANCLRLNLSVEAAGRLLQIEGQPDWLTV